MPLLRDDRALLARFRAGCPDALTAVYRWYAPAVARALAIQTSAAPLEAGVESADLLQEVFLRAFSDGARRSYDGRRRYGPYLLSIARHLLIDHVRRGHVVRAAVALTLDERPASGADGDQAAVLAEVERYLRQLPTPLQRVHEFRYVLALSQDQAASRLGTTRQRLRTLERRLTHGLRAALGLSAPLDCE